jgi:putative Mg2+ transporter-C (MgtC) family protein
MQVNPQLNKHMDWQIELLMAAQAVLATFLGGLIGWEREQHGREAGIRTYASVCLGACVFGLVSSHIPNMADNTRIAAQIVSGVGFLGAGVIMHDQGRLKGLTTAGTLWATAAVGLAIAFGMYVLGILTALLLYGLLALHHLPGWGRVKTPSERPPGGEE